LNIYFFKGERNSNTSSGILLKRALHLYNHEYNLGLTSEKIANEEICKNEKGKPFFNEINLEFSISHSGDIWVCAIGNCRVGIDIQIKKNIKPIEISKRFFAKEESDYVAKTGIEIFFKIWAMKEAYVKFIGEGISYGFDKFSVLKNGELIDMMEPPNQCYFQRIEVSKSYECFICANTKEKNEIRNIRNKEYTK
jgi:4'-phosphopantetheinyl transferase